ncbi:NAD(P)-binding protein [Corynespora cassiicola Philippines]|uniref:NAD(P)-binding protein n=1 Tax=Corynespora cassiicola Philippines TaxID=1448308 RepID=A0A2T2N4W8_CORCC|nr:NAD(P)-binding protein [Corynespora cassiicola Philippines]
MALVHAGISLKGRIFSITGGASGMGLATARLLAHHGAGAIWIADRQTKLFDSVNKELSTTNPSTKVYLENVDVSKSAEVNSWIDRIVKNSGVLHGSANIAGLPERILEPDVGKPSLLIQTDEDWHRIHSVNLHGVMYCTRAQFHVMHKMPKDSNPAIVNVSSMAALLHQGGGYAYCTSKAATEHFTRNAAKDAFRFGIRVNGILSGNTLTPMTKEFFGGDSAKEIQAKIENTGLRSVIQAGDVARAIVWLLSENSLNVNGVSLPVGEGAP